MPIDLIFGTMVHPRDGDFAHINMRDFNPELTKNEVVNKFCIQKTKSQKINITIRYLFENRKKLWIIFT